MSFFKGILRFILGFLKFIFAFLPYRHESSTMNFLKCDEHVSTHFLGLESMTYQLRLWQNCKVGPEPIVINGVMDNPYKWPKINGFAWVYFTPINGVIGPYL